MFQLISCPCSNSYPFTFLYLPYYQSSSRSTRYHSRGRLKFRQSVLRRLLSLIPNPEESFDLLHSCSFPIFLTCFVLGTFLIRVVLASSLTGFTSGLELRRSSYNLLVCSIISQQPDSVNLRFRRAVLSVCQNQGEGCGELQWLLRQLQMAVKRWVKREPEVRWGRWGDFSNSISLVVLSQLDQSPIQASIFAKNPISKLAFLNKCFSRLPNLCGARVHIKLSLMARASSPSSPPASRLKTFYPFLHFSMVLLIICTLYNMVNNPANFSALAIFISVCYIYLAWRTTRTSAKHSGKPGPPMVVHSLDELRPGYHGEGERRVDINGSSMEMKPRMNKSVLVKEFEQLNSSREISFPDQSNRVESSFNKSKLADKSMRRSLMRSKSPNKSGGDSNFIVDFLTNKEDNSFLKSKINASFFRGVDAKAEEEQLRRTEMSKIYDEVNEQYQSTINNFFNMKREDLMEKYQRVQRIAVDKAREVYRLNIQNIREIVRILEANYDISIKCGQSLPQLSQKASSFEQYSQPQSTALVTYELEEALFICMNKNFSTGLLPFPRKKSQTRLSAYPQVSLVEAGLLKTDTRGNPILGETKKVMQRLFKERYDQDTLLHWSGDKMQVKTIMQNLRLLRRFIEVEDSSFGYINENSFSMSEEESLRKLAGFNLLRSWINLRVVENSEEQMLIFEENSIFKSLMGRKKHSHWEIRREAKAEDYGHPHFNLIYKDQKSGKQVKYTPRFGSMNGMSLIFMYLHQMREIYPNYAKSNTKMRELIAAAGIA